MENNNYHNYTFSTIRKGQLVKLVKSGHISADQANKICEMRDWRMKFKSSKPVHDNKKDVMHKLLEIGKKFNTMNELEQELLQEEIDGKWDHLDDK